jgi:hypothetical protein
MAPADILAVVEDQFYDVRKRLDAQLTRTAEIQQQLEGQRKENRRAPTHREFSPRPVKRTSRQKSVARSGYCN